ncbi:WAT1-related protein At3g28050-like isoform X6 [Camellia sinensis]|uniref:WAT1-related protein At3g28050-like isoform X6 n=1 Tax=Camellia sinensis TaxID=4442 RepID=UPI0010362881|nr:WAT1-related protein At3g28050-like isoform X6 [Camellia sinensis]
MGMKEALPFLGMVSIQFIQVGMIVAVKEATSHGLTKFTFVFYSNSLAALILLPTSFLLHSCTSQVVGNVAVQITPASFSTAIMNLVPGFTFTLAVIFRLEQADFKSSSTLAKSIGTIVSIVGALIVTLYKGPSLLMTATQYNLVLGAFLLTIECLSSSAYIITQAFLLTEFGAELIIVFFFSFFVAIMTGILSLVMERDPAAWSLLPSVKLLSILFSGIVGSSIQASILLWCLRQRGPLFTAVFPPLGIVISTVVGIIIFGDILYLGSVVGSIIIVIGFYSVMWGKSKEQKVITDDEETSSESPREKAPLLQNIRETSLER